VQGGTIHYNTVKGSVRYYNTVECGVL
jgi:hypothetical protein